MAPPLDDWPAEGLDQLGACPCCGSSRRTSAFQGLRDLAFRAAPGSWTLWRCEGCGCGYLDPRPSAATIGAAYANYYTHGGGSEPAEARSLLRRAGSFVLYRAFDPEASAHWAPAGLRAFLEAFR